MNYHCTVYYTFAVFGAMKLIYLSKKIGIKVSVLMSSYKIPRYCFIFSNYSLGSCKYMYQPNHYVCDGYGYRYHGTRSIYIPY